MSIKIAGYELNENLPLIGVSIWDMLIAVVAPIVGVIVAHIHYYIGAATMDEKSEAV